MLTLSAIAALLALRLPNALLAVGLSALLGLTTGPLGGNAGPPLWLAIDKVFGPVGRRLDRPERKVTDLIMRGFALTLLALAVLALLGFAAWHAARYVPFHAGEGALLVPVLSTGAVWRLIGGLRRTLRGGPQAKNGKYLALARSARIDFSGTDDHAMSRAGIAYAARGFDKALVLPLFWYLVGGLPSAYIAAGLAALIWRFGRDGFGRGFTALAQMPDALLGAVPNALAGLFLGLAALLTPGGNIFRAFWGLSRLKNRVPHAEGGLPVVALAWAFKIGLGGPAVDLDGRTLARGWAGPDNATAQIEAGYLARALYLVIVATLLLAAALAAGWLATGWYAAGLAAPPLPAVKP